MARTRGEVNKSEAIREALKANPGKPPKEIAAMLNEQGLKISATYVSMIKGKMKKTGRRGPGRPRGVSSTSASGMNPLEAAVAFVRASGGIDAAKRAIAAIEEIQRLR